MSVDSPKVAVAFGSVAPPQGDIADLRVHLGCTSEVSSFECLLQNWDGKYSAGGAYPILVGVDGHVDVGRGVNVPQLLTCRVESVKFESSPVENYLRVSGRCWGERLFRRVVTKTYAGVKGEAIVKDLLDNYCGLSHVRDAVELVEDTDTTYTRLAYDGTPVFDVIKSIAESADKSGVMGFDFRTAPDGKFEFFPRNSKASAVSLAERIESSEYVRDVHRVRNRIVVYGAADKSVPSDKDSWTESLTPADGDWTAVSGSVSLDAAEKKRGSWSIRTSAVNLSFAGCVLTLNSGSEVDCDLYPVLSFLLRHESAFNGNVNVLLFDSADQTAGHFFTAGAGEWFQERLRVGAENADVWDVEAGFDWASVKSVRFDCWFSGSGSGSFWVDGLFFGGRRYSAVEEGSGSQLAYGLRELVEVDEELYSDAECSLRAKALLDCLKDPAESLVVKSSVVDFGSAPLLAGDTVHVALPNEGVDADFRVLSVDYHVDAGSQTLELAIELGRERPLLADYLFALRSKTDSLSRYKIARVL